MTTTTLKPDGRLKTEQTYEGALAEYLENPKTYLGKLKGEDNLGKPFTRNIVKVEFHYDNEPFKELVKWAEHFSNDEEMSQYFDFEKRFINSTVEIDRDKHLLRQHNKLIIDTAFGEISIAPYFNGLEITRIIVNAERGKGRGKLLMDSFFNLLILGVGEKIVDVPIMLECVGAVGGGSNYVQSTISMQTRFFRKFGFRVDPKVSNYSKSYVQMKIDSDLFSEYLVTKMDRIFFGQEETVS